MRAVCLNCTLKRSPETSSTASLSDVVMSALRGEGVELETIRLVDHRIEPGVIHWRSRGRCRRTRSRPRRRAEKEH